MAVVTTVEPAVEPISLTEAKSHCRVSASTDDTYLTSLIVLARERVEIETQRALISQTKKLVADDFPAGRVIPLEFPPLQSVSSVKYYASGETTLSTFASTSYRVDTALTPGRIVLKDGYEWPEVWDELSSVEITYVCGYGAAGSNVPSSLVHATKMLVSHWYENREPIRTAPGQMMPVPRTVENLLFPYRVW